MNIWLVVSVILFVFVIYLLYRLGKRVGDLALSKKQEKREWTLKVALEKTFSLPTVEAEELRNIEPQLERIINGPGTDEETEEQMRLAVMELYAQKAEKRGRKG
jgi:hypothetical protein